MKGVKVQSVLLSWILLLYFDWVMRFGGFSRVHEVLRQRKVRSTSKDRESDPDLSRAVDLACVFYFKRVLCLQRSAALAVLLRHHGTKAKMIIGAQIVPFLSHAWVEVDGCVINDRPYVGEIFEVLDRC